MSRKSLVKERCDAFENEGSETSSNKLHTAGKLPKENKYLGLPNNKRPTLNTSLSNKIEYKSNIPQTDDEVQTRKRQESFQSFGTLKDRISKFNNGNATLQKQNTLKVSSSNSIQNNDCMSPRPASITSQFRDYYNGNDFRTQTLNNKEEKQVGKLNMSAFEIFLNDDHRELLSPRLSKCDSSEKAAKYFKASISLEINEANFESSNDDGTKNEQVKTKNLPAIPAKPKYINKIKPHPDMSAKSKEKLQEKIKIFNELSNGKSIYFGQGKSVERTTSDDDSTSDENIATEYDVVENLNITKITVEKRYNISDCNEENSTVNVRRETYYDHNLNPRIERISRQVQKVGNTYEDYDLSKIKKSTMIIHELLQTELVYFKGLARVYEDYILYFKESPYLCAPTISKVFGNFEEIYKHQLEFYGELTDCNNNPDAVAEVFLKNTKLFDLYEKYIVNKHISSKYSTGECLQAIQARDKELGNKLNLESYLLTPVQRLLRYLLLLKNLQDALSTEDTRYDKLNEAVEYLETLIEGTNIHAKMVQRIQNSPIDFVNKGKYLMSDEFILRNNKKKHKSTVILFEDVIVFTRKVDAETYIYKDSININDLYIRSIADDLVSFQLQNFTEFRQTQDRNYVFDLEAPEPKIKNEWEKKIESLLWNQFAAHKKKL